MTRDTHKEKKIRADRSRTRDTLQQLACWFDSSRGPDAHRDGGSVQWLRAAPFVGMHLGCLGVLWTGCSGIALAIAAALYFLRMFAITAFYHRYFSHRAFRTSRPVQFAFALMGASAVQRGPLWWASQHRHHHAHSDRPADAHSPRIHGFFWSHAGWFLSSENFPVRFDRVRDLARFPELRFLDRFDALVPLLLAALLYVAGALLETHVPRLGTTGPQLLAWGFFVSTVALYHATFCVNSLAHRSGSRRYLTGDDSRNNWWLALLTLGEGWHNNHHHYPGAARQGFYWWELDITYLLLRLLAACGLIQDLRPVPARWRDARRHRRRVGPAGCEAAPPTADLAGERT